MALGARPSGSRGERASGTEYEGRLSALQEGMHEGLIYQDDEDGWRGPPQASGSYAYR